MAHLAVVAPPFPGHFNPLQVLAGELVARGHRITFVQQPDAARLISDPRIGFAAVGTDTHPPGALDGAVNRINALNGLWGMGGVISDLVRSTDMLCRELPGMLGQLQVDAVIADQTEAAGGLVARFLRVPQLSIANALPINSEPGVPPPFTAWAYDPSERGRGRNMAGYRVAELIMWRMQAVIKRWAAAWHLGPLRTLQDCLSPQLQLSQMIPGLDFPRHALPAGFHYTGPWRSIADDVRPVPPLPPRPFAFVTLGTLQGNRLGLFRAIAEACAECDLHCLIAHGGRLSPLQAASLPRSATVYDFVPQRAVLAHAALAITHGGMNTALDAMASGAPVVALPLAFEQSAIAARLVHAGAGLVVTPRWLRTSRLAEKLRIVLGTAAYRDCAKRLRDEIATSGGVILAADLIDNALQNAIHHSSAIGKT